jgi:sugar phosphate isomerase/epimerase
MAGVRVTVVDALLSALPGSPRPADVAPEHAPVFEFDEQDCYEIADALGAETLNIAHFLGTPVPVVQLVDAIGPIRERAHTRGLRTTLEFIPDTGVPDVATAAHIVAAIGASDFGIMLDTWHLARSGGDATDLTELVKGSITGTQINDRIEPPAGEVYVPSSGRLLPGDGVLPLADILQAVVAQEVEPVNFGIEVFSAELNRLSAPDAAARAANALHAVLREAGY